MGSGSGLGVSPDQDKEMRSKHEDAGTSVIHSEQHGLRALAQRCNVSDPPAAGPFSADLRACALQKQEAELSGQFHVAVIVIIYATISATTNASTCHNVELPMDPLQQPENTNIAGLNGEDEMVVDPPANVLPTESPTPLGEPMDVDDVFMDVDPDVERGQDADGIPMNIDEAFVHGIERSEAVPMEVDEVFGGNEDTGEAAAGVQRGASGRGPVFFNCTFEVHIHIHQG
ncbi:hypothetical protein DENSPDRAFT_885078 [Dentipellis sp. KUC8613]|nr:hypothetical protein DENSPDRAFT_885078 [Dentipellis sp. KUC8613]